VIGNTKRATVAGKSGHYYTVEDEDGGTHFLTGMEMGGVSREPGSKIIIRYGRNMWGGASWQGVEDDQTQDSG